MKRIIGLVLILMLLLTGCSKQHSAGTVTGKDTEVTTRLENAIELQKNVFVGKINAIDTKDAVITKYNLDISTYTVYTVDVIQSLDGYTPLGEIKAYCVGTSEEIVTRIGMKKGDTYIIDAQPWVLGDEVIYLLSVYTVAYPRIDIAGMVTLETADGQLLSSGSLEDYVKSYDASKTAVGQRIENFADTKNTLQRVSDIFEEIYTKNSKTDFYTSMDFKYTPSDEFIKQTADNSKKIYDECLRLLQSETVTDTDIAKIYTFLK